VLHVLCFESSLVQKVCGKVQERSSPVPSTQQFSSDGNRPSLLLKAFARAARHGQLLSRQFYSLYQERHDPVSIHTQLSNTAVSLSITVTWLLKSQSEAEPHKCLSSARWLLHSDTIHTVLDTAIDLELRVRPWASA
jgi:hypothetical protein